MPLYSPTASTSLNQVKKFAPAPVQPQPVQQAVTASSAPASTISPTAAKSTLSSAGATKTYAPAPVQQTPTQALQKVPVIAQAVGGYLDAQGRPTSAPNPTGYINEYGQPALPPTPPSAATIQAARPAPVTQYAPVPQQPAQTLDFWDDAKEVGGWVVNPIGKAAEEFGAPDIVVAAANPAGWAAEQGVDAVIDTVSPYLDPDYWATVGSWVGDAVDYVGDLFTPDAAGGGAGTQLPPVDFGATGAYGAGGAVSSTGPGITGGVPQSQFAGVDMTQRGAAEQFFYDNAWRFALPNDLTEQGAWWQQNMGQVGTPGVGETTFNQVAPGLSKAGGGENYVSALTKAYGPGNYPTGTNLSADVAAGYRPTSLGQGIGERVGAEIGTTYRPGETPGVSNRAEEFYQQFLGEMPDIMSDPGLEPYYANARRKAAEEINRNMAARGMWGSSAAGDMITEANVNLGAEQANREAQFYLDRLAEARNWQETGGRFASSADTSSRGQAENERAWTRDLADVAAGAQGLELERAGENRLSTALGADIARSADDVSARNAELERDWAATLGGLGLEGDAASRARASALLSGANDAQRAMLERLGFGQGTAQNLDEAELQRLAAGQNAAASAQNAARQRAQDYFNNTMGMGSAMEGVMTGQYNPMITEDKTLLDDILAMITGAGAERLAGAQRQTAGAQQTQNANQELALMTILKLFGM